MRKQDLDNWLTQLDSGEAEAGVEEADPELEAEAPGEELRDLTDLWQPEQQSSSVAADVGQRLVEQGMISAAELTQARQVHQKTPGKRLAEVLTERGVEEAAVQQAVGDLAGLEFERVSGEDVDARLLERLGVEYCKANGVAPLREAGRRIVVGVIDPQRVFMLDEVRRRFEKPIKLVLVTTGDLGEAMESHTQDQGSDVAVDEIIKDIEEDDVEVVEAREEEVDLEKEAGESPVIRFVNYLIHDAVRQGASDIHIEPGEKNLRVRYRIDGVLFEMMHPPRAMHAAMVSRLKIMANLDISERRLPQDGRVRAVVQGRKLDLRLSTLPTGHGEKAVLRVLDSRSAQVTLNELGMPEQTLQMWKHQISEPHGIILVTGPTGSGKTTTLYSSLNQMDRNKLNISTVEDPIEYHLSGINQVQTHEKIGLSFASSLRSLLRQDPDVVMVGEVRDEETARTAVQAALTGHLVLSTLHTNDAPSSITRLINIGVEPYLIGAGVNAVLAQRLVRRICEHCKKPCEVDDETAEHLAMHGITVDQVMAGEGCPKCHDTGYAGRVGLYEMLVLDDTVRDMITQRPSVTEFRRVCVERGMVTLRMDGFGKVAEGRTTVEEVLRVTQSMI